MAGRTPLFHLFPPLAVCQGIKERSVPVIRWDLAGPFPAVGYHQYCDDNAGNGHEIQVASVDAHGITPGKTSSRLSLETVEPSPAVDQLREGGGEVDGLDRVV